MQPDLKHSALLAIRRALSGLVRLSLRVGISVDEFEEVVRESYFGCARDDYGIKQRPTNLARVAVLTGLSRKECGRLKRKAAAQAESESAEPAPSSMNPATRVMSVWATDPEYSGVDGPNPLPVKGEGASLTNLIAEHVGDIPYGAVVAELNRVGALATETDGRMRLVQRSFLPAGLNEDKLRILANQFEDLGTTVVFNLDEVERSRLQRYVVNEDVPADRLQEFQTLATDLAQSVLEQLDGWLSKHQVSKEESGRQRATVRTGLGMYYFETP